MSAGVAQPLPPAPVRPWRVLHACESLHHLQPLIEGQLAVGMRPALVTPEGCLAPENCLTRYAAPPRPLSLLTAWGDVRRWRGSMLEAGASTAAEVVHAHSFASGMAAVRNCPAVVYDLDTFVEELAALNAAENPPGAWLSRSFRVAEQFILARAGAVVVHRSSMRERALERGAAEPDLFMIPEPLPAASLECPLFEAETRPGGVCFYAPGVAVPAAGAPIPPQLIALLRALSMVAEESGATCLRLEASEAEVAAVRRELGLRGSELEVRCAGDDALAGSDICILFGQESRATEALARGLAVLAGDVPANRDLSPEGRGWLWFRDGDARDLAARAAFLARHPDFRRLLGGSARRFMLETRGPQAIASQYDVVYRRAASRRRGNGSIGTVALQPVASRV